MKESEWLMCQVPSFFPQGSARSDEGGMVELGRNPLPSTQEGAPALCSPEPHPVHSAFLQWGQWGEVGLCRDPPAASLG